VSKQVVSQRVAIEDFGLVFHLYDEYQGPKTELFTAIHGARRCIGIGLLEDFGLVFHLYDEYQGPKTELFTAIRLLTCLSSGEQTSGVSKSSD